jgi:hypothetical protein
VEAESLASFFAGAGMDSRLLPNMSLDSAEAARSRQTPYTIHHTDFLLAFSHRMSGGRGESHASGMICGCIVEGFNRVPY